MILRHWPSAWTWLSTVLMSSSVAPFGAIKLVCTGRKCSAMMCSSGVRHQVMDVGDPAGDRILDRDHARASPSPPRTAAKASSKVAHGSGFAVGIGLADGEMRIGARLALEGDLAFHRLCHVFNCRFPSRQFKSTAAASMARARLQVLRRIDAERHGVDDRHVDAHAGLQRAQLLEPLALFERRRRQRDEALQRGAPIGVKPDVVVERPLAGRRGGAGEIERAQPRPARPASRRP